MYVSYINNILFLYKYTIYIKYIASNKCDNKESNYLVNYGIIVILGLCV